MKYENGTIVVILDNEYFKYDELSYDYFNQLNNCKIGKIIRCYKGDENYSYHGSPWYSDYIDIKFSDGTIYTWDSITSKKTIMSKDDLLKEARIIKSKIVFKIQKLNNEKDNYKKIIEKIKSLR